MGAVFVVAVLISKYANNDLSFSLAKAYAGHGSVVSLYVDDSKRIVSTDAGTVGDVLKQFNVDLAPGDIVEPSANTPIDQADFNINVYRGMPVMIVDGNKTLMTQSAYQSPRQIVTGAGLPLFDEDEVTLTKVTEFATDNFVGNKVVIKRAKPVEVVVGAQTYNFRTQAKTVEQLLAEHNLQLSSSDLINTSQTDPIYEGQRIIINRVNQNVVTESETITAGVKITYDDTLPVGTEQVKQAGSDGILQKTYLVTYKDNVETNRGLLESKVLKPAVDKIIVRGRQVAVGSKSDIIALAQQMAADRGWTGAQWTSVYNIISRESNWNVYARNAKSGACGLGQDINGCEVGYDAAAQINWTLNYIARRYSNPNNAWAYWLAHGNY